jgi:hypothetical protein
MVPPRCKFVVDKAATNGVRRDMLNDTLMFQWSGEFATIPWGEGATELIWPLAGHLDQMDRHLGGNILARDRGQVCRQDPPYVG